MRITSTLAATALIAVIATPAAAAPLTASPAYPAEPPGRLVIHATGDVTTSPDSVAAVRSSDFADSWTGVGDIFRRDDLTLINLECDPTDRGTLLSDKPYSFRCPPESLAAMKAAGVDVASMGNNHSGDYGDEGLLDGRANLAAAGLNPVGAGKDLTEANAAVFFDLDGRRVAVLAFSAVSGVAYEWPYTPDDHANLRSPWFATTERAGVAPATVANMTAAVAAVRPQVDLVIVMLHQGVFNETRHPFADEIERAHALIDAGADVVFAHHHHRVLPMETYRGRPIFYGLGSFVFSRLEPDRNISAVAEIVVSPDGAVTGRLIPALIVSSGHPVLRGAADYQVRIDRALVR